MEEPTQVPQVRQMTSTRAPGFQTPGRQRTPPRGLQESCGESRDGVGNLQAREGAKAPRKPPGKARALAAEDPVASPGLLPWDLVLLAWAQVHHS